MTLGVKFIGNKEMNKKRKEAMTMIMMGKC